MTLDLITKAKEKQVEESFNQLGRAFDNVSTLIRKKSETDRVCKTTLVEKIKGANLYTESAIKSEQ